MPQQTFDTDLANIACGLIQTHLYDYQGTWLHKDIVSDFDKLKTNAMNAGFELSIASAYRDFERQMRIWNGKFQGERTVLDKLNKPIDLSQLNELDKCHAIMLFSALPGGSRHHFGTDLDVYAGNFLKPGQKLHLEPWEYQSGGPFYEFNNWLDENLASCGFYRPYAQYNGGVAAEPWHISHINTAKHLNDAQNINNLSNAISQFEVAGKDTILANLSDLHARYIRNISLP